MLLIGFRSGKVVLYNVSARSLHQKFTLCQPSANHPGVARFIQYPPNFCANADYAVLFADSLIVALDSNTPNVESLQESRRMLNKANNPKTRHCHHKVPENRFRILEEDKQWLMKLNCQTVSDIQLVGSPEIRQYIDCG